ncbi:mannosyl-oligosaccharide alpha-1,2-mannosidase [Actinomortierella ambigua]|uniref:alpha-1,2-Mannosidase n=1 Tax=Actinomortierella ambigua TaxID=1343610 RepID=A0A9P6PSN7_9FUNG|nr:mannosyl-oligosaccharide alpha-1,2-mannosidase [Actinomortierella ambigua]
MFDSDNDDKYGKAPFQANRTMNRRFRFRKRHAVLAACLFSVGYVILRSNDKTTARLPSSFPSFSSSKGQQQHLSSNANQHFLQEKYSGPGVAIGGGPGAPKGAGGGGGAPKEKEKKKKKAPPTLFEYGGNKGKNKNNKADTAAVHVPPPPPPPPPPIAVAQPTQFDSRSSGGYSDEDDEGSAVEVENELSTEDHGSSLADRDSPSHQPLVNPSTDPAVWKARQQSVKDAFVYAWDAYRRDAWGKDEYHPVLRHGTNMIVDGLGFTIVDALDTIMLMGLQKEYEEARAWVRDTLTFDQDNDVNLFETTIRVLGGLLSAYDQSGHDKVFLDKAVDLADRLMAAFVTPTGIPYSSVNLKDRRAIPNHDMGGASSTSEVSTIQLEFKYLSHITGDPKYWKAAERVIHLMKDMRTLDGLVPIYINPDQGRFYGSEIRLGSRGDSYYEYLLKQYLQTGKTESIYREMYDQTVVGIKKHLVGRSYPNNLLYIGEVDMYGLQRLSPKMDHLVCFLGGTMALGATEGVPLSHFPVREASLPSVDQEDFKMGEELTRSCYEMYRQTDTGLASEIVVWLQKESDANGRTEKQRRPGSDFYIKDMDGHNWLRPEAVESLFYMWRFTGDLKYRQWGWEIFEAIEKYSKVLTGGYSSIHDIRDRNNIRFSDKMETFFLAETLKYLYLLFGEDDVLPLDKYVFNTEAHPFPIFTPSAEFLEKLRLTPLPPLIPEPPQRQWEPVLDSEMVDITVLRDKLVTPKDDEDDADRDEVDQGLNDEEPSALNGAEEEEEEDVNGVEVDYEPGEEFEMDDAVGGQGEDEAEQQEEEQAEEAEEEEEEEEEDDEEDEEDDTALLDEFEGDNEDEADDEGDVNLDGDDSGHGSSFGHEGSL